MAKNWNFRSFLFLVAALLAAVAAATLILQDKRRSAPRDPPKQLEPAAIRVFSASPLELEDSAAGRASLAVPPSNAAPLTVIVESTGGLAVGAAEIYWTPADKERWQGAGRTGADGVATVQIPDAASRMLVKAQGFKPALLVLSRESSSEIRVILHPGGTIAGQVRSISGLPPRAPVHVLAKPLFVELPRPGPEEPGGATSWPPLCEIATTAGDGAFRLSGLDPAMPYELYAGGKGLLSLRPPITVKPDSGNAELLVGCWAGLLLEVRQKGGEPLQVNERLHGLGDLAWRILDEGCANVSLGSPTCRLAGLWRSEWLDRPETRFRKLLLFAVDSSERSACRIELACNVPGYQPAAATLAARPLDSGLPEYVVELEPVARAWGSLTVIFDGTNLSALNGARPVPGEIVLASAEKQHFELRVPNVRDGEYRASGIPAGRYQIYFRSRERLFRFPRRIAAEHPYTIGAVPCEFRVDLSEAASLEIEVDPGNYPGWSYGESISGVLTQSGSGQSYSFDHPPYFLALIAPGSYDVQCWQFSQKSRRVDLAPAALAKVTFSIPLE